MIVAAMKLRPSYVRRTSVALGLALGIAGCGGPIVDEHGAEDRVSQELDRVLKVRPAAVDCPADVPVESGKRFRCKVDVAGSGPVTAVVKVMNESADLEIVALSRR